MAGIHVLSDTPKGGQVLEKGPTQKGKDVSGSNGNAAGLFAAVLNGSMTPKVGAKGQHSKADQDTEEKEDTSTPIQSALNPTFLAQLMLQSDLPAGKEANSGDNENQGTGGILTTADSLAYSQLMSVVGNNPSLEMFNKLTLVSDGGEALTGMTVQNSQGNAPQISELDQYKQIISELLVALSGKITDSSQKGSVSELTSTQVLGFQQEMTKIIQGWMTQTDDSSSKTQVNSQVANRNQAQANVDGILSGGEIVETKGLQQEITKIIQGLMAQSDDVANKALINGEEVNNDSKASILLKALDNIFTKKTSDSNTSQNVSIVPLAEGQKITPLVKVKGDLQTLQVNRSDFDQDAPKDNAVFGAKAVQNQTINSGTGLAINVPSANVVDGKSLPLPVWQQISTSLREHGLNGQQGLKNLDIQLHPADLGKVHILLQWDNGKVNLQVQASENSTSQLLQSQLPELRQNLTSQGINCGMMQMGQGGDQRQNPQRDASQRTIKQNSDVNQTEDLIPDLSLSLGQDGINRINVTA